MIYSDSYAKAKEIFEKTWLEKAMVDCHYNQSRAAVYLDMSRSTLRTKLRQYFGNKYFKGEV